MIESELAKRMLAVRRDYRDRKREGWELVGERGGKLWELHRGGRLGHKITDVRIATSGRELWIKTAPPDDYQPQTPRK